ncbi:MAG: Uridine kinase [Parcubacteria bacterium OLB19]|nr:MAG: Uridine kinase [Parcubacteria bacterium OLB19]
MVTSWSDCKLQSLMNSYNNTDIFDRMVDGILNISSNKAIIVAIDGVDASGKTNFAKKLYKSLRLKHSDVLLASVDDFHNQRLVRYAKGVNSPEGFYFDSFNYSKLKDLLLDPFKNNRKFVQLKYFDCDSDKEVFVKKTRISPSTILIVEGIFLHRPNLIKYWDYSFFLKVDFDVALERNINRETDKFRIGNIDKIISRYRTRYQPGQQLYIKDSRPEEKSDIVIDNSNYTLPIVIKHNFGKF